MPRKKLFTINKARRALYKSARVLGDVNAVKRGKVPQRMARKGLIKAIMRLFKW